MVPTTTNEPPPNPDALLTPLCANAESVKRITPTDVSQFVWLEQCERFLPCRGHDGERSPLGPRSAENLAKHTSPTFTRVRWGLDAYHRPGDNPRRIRCRGAGGPEARQIIVTGRSPSNHGERAEW